MAVQVSSIAFFEHHVFRRDRGGVQLGPDAVQRKCIMQAELINRTDSSLQVSPVITTVTCLVVCLHLHCLPLCVLSVCLSVRPSVQLADVLYSVRLHHVAS